MGSPALSSPLLPENLWMARAQIPSLDPKISVEWWELLAVWWSSLILRRSRFGRSTILGQLQCYSDFKGNQKNRQNCSKSCSKKAQLWQKKTLNSIEKTDKSPNVQIVQTGCSKRVQSSWKIDKFAQKFKSCIKVELLTANFFFLDLWTTFK